MALDHRHLIEDVKRTAKKTDWTMVLAACALVAIGIIFICFIFSHFP